MGVLLLAAVLAVVFFVKFDAILGGIGGEAGGRDAPGRSSGIVLKSQLAARVTPTPTTSAASAASWTRSSGGWRNGSAVAVDENGTVVHWQDSSNAISSDPLETLTASPSEGALSAWSSGDGWGYNTAWVNTYLCANYHVCWFDNVKLRVCDGADDHAICSTLLDSTAKAGTFAHVLSVSEQVSSSDSLSDGAGRGVLRALTGLGAGVWKVSFETVCALTGDANSGTALGPCDGVSDGAGGGAFFGIYCNNPVPTAGWSAPDTYVAIPPYRSKARFEHEIALATSSCPATGSPVLALFAMNDDDATHDRVGIAGATYPQLTTSKEGVATAYWRNFLVDDMRIEKVYVDAAEMRTGLTDYLQILGKAGISSSSSPTRVEIVSPSADPSLPANALRRTQTLAVSGEGGSSEQQLKATYFEVWHAPRTVYSGDSVPVAETKGRAYLAVLDRPDEGRPWTVPSVAEAERGTTATWAVPMYHRASGGEVTRQWFLVRNASSTSLAANQVTFGNLPSGWKLYAVVQEPVFEDYTPSSTSALTATYKIVPAFLSRCTATDSRSRTYCEQWGVPAQSTRSYVLEAPAAASPTLVPLGFASPAGGGRLYASLTSYEGPSTNRSNILWGFFVGQLSGQTSGIGDLAQRLRDHGVTDVPLGAYLAGSDSADDPAYSTGDATIHFQAKFNNAEGNSPTPAEVVAEVKNHGMRAGAILDTAAGKRACNNSPGLMLSGVTFKKDSEVPYFLDQADHTLVKKAAAGVYSKVVCPSSGCDAASWAPKVGDMVACAGGIANGFASYGRIGAIGDKVLYLDAPLRACAGSTLYLIVHTGLATTAVADALHDDQISCDWYWEDAEGVKHEETSQAVGSSRCPAWAEVSAEIDSSNPDHETMDETWRPLTCQRPMVDNVRAGLYECKVDGASSGFFESTDACAEACSTGSCSAIDGVAMTCRNADGTMSSTTCQTWNKLNAAQRRFVDLLATLFRDLVSAAGEDNSDQSLFMVTPWYYDETWAFASPLLGLFDGFGQTEHMGIIDQLERGGLRTMMTPSGHYHAAWWQSNQVSELLPSTYSTASTWRRLDASVGKHNALLDLCPTADGQPSCGQISDLSYHGAFSYMDRSPFTARLMAGLVHARMEMDLQAAGVASLPTYSMITYGLHSPGGPDRRYSDPFYSASCSATSGGGACYALYRDTLDFGDFGFPKTDALSMGLLLPGSSSAKYSVIDSTYEETVAWDMLLAGLRDRLRFTAQTSAAADSGAGAIESVPYFGQVSRRGAATWHGSGCTLARVTEGATDAVSVCGDFLSR
ncbi:MAG: hypothetical protein HYV63_11360 [Candidatus Schekmanbacteria bacterium]|nr:hypothetical protein [Candidatus Schekmanbacteria bacterium]